MYTKKEIISILENIDKNLTYDTWKSEMSKVDLYIEKTEEVNLTRE